MPRLLHHAVTMFVVNLLLLPVNVSAGESHFDVDQAAGSIDGLILRDLQGHDLQPNAPASDNQFVRRVYLDVIGRIPTAHELAKFRQDTRKDRRASLGDELLASPGHVSHMFNWLGDMLRVKDGYYRIGKTYTFHTWLKKRLEQNRPRGILSPSGP